MLKPYSGMRCGQRTGAGAYVLKTRNNISIHEIDQYVKRENYVGGDEFQVYASYGFPQP